MTQITCCWLLQTKKIQSIYGPLWVAIILTYYSKDLCLCAGVHACVCTYVQGALLTEERILRAQVSLNSSFPQGFLNESQLRPIRRSHEVTPWGEAQKDSQTVTYNLDKQWIKSYKKYKLNHHSEQMEGSKLS